MKDESMNSVFVVHSTQGDSDVQHFKVEGVFTCKEAAERFCQEGNIISERMQDKEIIVHQMMDRWVNDHPVNDSEWKLNFSAEQDRLLELLGLGTHFKDYPRFKLDEHVLMYPPTKW